MQGFDSSYEVCNCRRVSLKQIQTCINSGSLTLGEIQDNTGAGTECRFCIIKETDFGKVKKKLYCKDILEYYKRSNNG
ncbi:(2Fe-2S)-binding protein [Malaciobacter mytili]|uniref:(2Fe-2S)-binding protein n=1 Tax=Malaciobacter mytili LMG 24559 TaxID=1032238 RepID=A0AAX2AE95_9BACT|nr:(2Fe-2S)-binding protein [Malaciobacter mytili]AXH15198.1 BFD-like [2Fe-2S]-binding domain-containing protein [Malaciobacter mytili LMG 24559]RXI45413.1 (2Fe-2S)-binding protein [Malaciobacter mytili]RXK15233.1 (2Fe-2S)-binding protein [Malaciobacter mytili LMG 24559]